MGLFSAPAMAGDAHHRWWLTNRMIAERYVREARALWETQTAADVNAALALTEKALSAVPTMEVAMEMKVRSLLFLRRWREVAEMLKEYIPSYRTTMVDEEGDSFTSTSSESDAQRVKLLPGNRGEEDNGFRCFSVADLKRKVMAGFRRSCDEEGHWRYLLLGHACYHLGLMDDAMVLLQTGRRLAIATLRRNSSTISEDNFTFTTTSSPATFSQPQLEIDSVVNLLCHIKLLLRRRAAANSAFEAGHPTEAIRHFSKIIDGHRGTPYHFSVNCLVGRATAHQAAGHPIEALTDLNRALALDPTHIPALRARAQLFELLRALHESLRDLDHLKLLYDSYLRKPTWRPHNDIIYRDVPINLRMLTHRIQELRLAFAASSATVDYYKLLGVRRGCTRAEIAQAHLLLSLRHRPEKAANYIDRLDFSDEHRGLDSVREQARMSALILYRMLQKGYSSIMSALLDEEAVERHRLRAVKEAANAAAVLRVTGNVRQEKAVEFQGGFCRDVAATGFGRVIPVKFEGLSC